jgi:hypothetical protein
MQYFLFGMVALAVLLVLMHGLAPATQAAVARRVALSVGIALVGVGGAMLLRNWGLAGLALASFGAVVVWRAASDPARRSAQRDADETAARVMTEHLDVDVARDTGVMRGQVLKGFFLGRRIEKLRAVELAHLWADCRFADPRSARMLEAHLDHVHPSWRDDMARTSGQRTSDSQDGGADDRSQPDADTDQRMTREEALDILGLKPSASDDQIRRAHRELMLKLHPDRGGSHVLAAKVNEAKDVLLG